MQTYVSKRALWLIVLLLGLIALRPLYSPPVRVSADAARFDYVYVVSPVYVYKGHQGILVMDKRNGHVWFIGRGRELDMKYADPVFVTQLPLDKLDQPPH